MHVLRNTDQGIFNINFKVWLAHFVGFTGQYERNYAIQYRLIKKIDEFAVLKVNKMISKWNKRIVTSIQYSQINITLIQYLNFILIMNCV